LKAHRDILPEKHEGEMKIKEEFAQEAENPTHSIPIRMEPFRGLTCPDRVLLGAAQSDARAGGRPGYEVKKINVSLRKKRVAFMIRRDV
jgi:hypothetical protein